MVLMKKRCSDVDFTGKQVIAFLAGENLILKK